MSYPTTWRRPPMFLTNPTLRLGFWLMIAVYLAWSMGTLDIDWGRVGQGLPRAGDMLARMFPPDFSRWDLLVSGVVESIEMAVAATLIESSSIDFARWACYGGDRFRGPAAKPRCWTFGVTPRAATPTQYFPSRSCAAGSRVHDGCASRSSGPMSPHEGVADV